VVSTKHDRLAIDPIEVVITKDEAGERLDRVLGARKLGLSRSQIQVLIEAGRVEADGVAVRASEKARERSQVVLRPLPPPPSAATPEDIPIDVLYEDSELLVVMKAAGMVVHPAPGHPGGTLVNALRYHRQVSADEESTERPGIVHRLDKDTSGIMVVAKTMAAREGLVGLFSTHDIEREYVALVQGHPQASFTLDTQHGRHPRDRKRFTTRVIRGKRAVTHVRVLERLHGASLVSCTLQTGRTHQIRVHLSEHGHPILGDPTYGKTSRDARVQAVASSLGRQALHARVLGFRHPKTGEVLRFVAEPPADFLAACAGLRS
jgi:23S rRNA pseudouridine1911/1915/1917 synthase